MRAAWGVESIRTAEAELMATLAPGTLMQRAASGLASVCAQVLRGSVGSVYGARIVLVVGSGDNGGDALFAGARLAERGARVEALLIAGHAHEGGLVALRRAGGSVREIKSVDDIAQTLGDADLVVDGIVGIGGSGPLREPAAEVAREMANCDALVVAVDLPSGIDANTGDVPGVCVSADVTATFGALKPGLLIAPGHEHVGVLTVVDIGLEPTLATTSPILQVLDADDVADAMPVAVPGDHKYSRGVVGIVAGSAPMPGAAILCTAGARIAGVGMVRVLDHNTAVATAVVTRFPDIVLDSADPCDDPRVNAWVCGPGLGRGDKERTLVRRVLDVGVPVVLDADALFHLDDPELGEALAARGERGLVTVLTPHEGEFARLCGAVGNNRIGAVQRAASESGVIMLLKGSTTLIAEPGGTTYVNTVAVPELATAGSGDVLSGLIGGLLASARDVDPLIVVAAAAYLHGLSGSRLAANGHTFTADELPDGIGAAISDLRASGRMNQ